MQFRAAALKSENHCDRIDADEAARMVRSGGNLVWIDVVSEDTPEARDLLIREFGFHELAVEDALRQDERPGVQEFEDTLFFVMPAWQGGVVEVGFFLTKDALVTVAGKTVPALEEWFARWERHPNRFGKHPAFLAHALVDGIVDGFFPVLDALEDEADELGERVFEGDSHHLRELLHIKRKLVELRRSLVPARDVLNQLLRRDVGAIPDDARIYFQDVFDHSLRLVEAVDVQRDTLTSLLDVHLSAVSNNLSEVVKRMTVFSTVLMTMALVAGIYGMNFDHMPELHWRFGYLFAIVLMFGLGALVIIGFKVAKWL
ncbi:magnesium/cobalt transporter CorA [bacterium]|nr:MAG: magnesium/cobalt transporter CorA [bacterium]